MKITTELQNEIDLMIHHITEELVNEFGKNREEAMRLIKKCEVEESLIKNELGFHEPPYNWAICILTAQNDYGALAKYFYLN